MRTVLVLLALSLLSACWQVEGDSVPAEAAIRVEGVKDGIYRRNDGNELVVRWNAAERVYDIGGGGVGAGKARAMRVGETLALVQFTGNLRLALLATLTGDDLVMLGPTPAVEKRLAAKHGVVLRPGPINHLSGPPSAVKAYVAEAATLPAADLVEAGRLVYGGALH
jgi:hypothetical protein